MSGKLVVGCVYVLMPNQIVVTLLKEGNEYRLKGVTAQGTVYCELIAENRIRYTFRRGMKEGVLEPLPKKESSG